MADLSPILADPYADAPRSTFADELSAADPADPRAEWIRLQIRLARERFAEPGDYPDREQELTRRITWLEAEEREAELREAHLATWSEPLLELVPGASFRYERGFAAGVTLSSEDFSTHASELFQAAPIVFLTLRDLGELEQTLAVPELARVRALSLASCGVGDAELETLSQAPSLAQIWWLDLSRNPFGLDGLRALAGSKTLPALRYVDFAGNRHDPRETVGTEWGRIVDVQSTPLGEELERDFGPLPWLHVQTEDASAYPPSPFEAP